MTRERVQEIAHHIDRGNHPTRPMAVELIQYIAELERDTDVKWREALRAAKTVADKDALDVLRAMLLFHSAGPWTEEKAGEFEALLHPILGDEPWGATTKTLCDAARKVLAP